MVVKSHLRCWETGSCLVLEAKCLNCQSNPIVSHSGTTDSSSVHKVRCPCSANLVKNSWEVSGSLWPLVHDESLETVFLMLSKESAAITSTGQIYLVARGKAKHAKSLRIFLLLHFSSGELLEGATPVPQLRQSDQFFSCSSSQTILISDKLTLKPAIIPSEVKGNMSLCSTFQVCLWWYLCKQTYWTSVMKVQTCNAAQDMT